jgi:hypothetical protein
MDKKVALLGLAFLGALTQASAQVSDSDSISVKYCGLGYLGRNSELSNNYKFYSKSILTNKDSIAQRSAQLLNLTKESNPKISFAESSNYAFSYILASEKYERQSFVYPIDKKTKYNNIFKVFLNTVLFDLQSSQIVGVYPWSFLYNEASDSPLSEEEISKHFEEFFQHNVRVVNKSDNEDSEDSNDMLGAWSKSLAQLKISSKQKTISVTPVIFSEEAKQSFNSPTNPVNLETLSKNLSTQYESTLSQKFMLPIVPNSTDNQFVASIPGCVGQGEISLVLPSPAYKFTFDIDQLKTATIESSNGHEVGYGARVHVQVKQTDDLDSVEGGKFILDNKLKMITSKAYIGERSFSDVDQYEKLITASMDQVSSAFINTEESWLKSHLSTEDKTKPSVVKKSWITVFNDKIGIPDKK